MARELREQDAGCAIAQAAAVVGEWWSLLIVREVTRGRHRFDDLHTELGISRRVLAERLKHLLDNGVLERRPYQQRPTRYEYRLTAAGRALAPVLAGLQDWGERFVLGDGPPAADATPTEIDRMHGLVGTAVPHPLALPVIRGGAADTAAPRGDGPGVAVPRGDGPGVAVPRSGALGVAGPGDGALGVAVSGIGGPGQTVAGDGGMDVVASDARVTVLLTCPGEALARFLGALSESATAFTEAGVAVRAVTTQEPRELRRTDTSRTDVPGAAAPDAARPNTEPPDPEGPGPEERAAAGAPDAVRPEAEPPGPEGSGAGAPDAKGPAAGWAFPVLSDAELVLCAALRLPTFRTGHTLHLKPAVIVADARRTIRHVLYPITDADAAIKDALRLATGVTARFVR